MNERVIQFRVGVVVVAATIITGILVMLFGEGRALVSSQYTIYLLFPQAPGVTVDTPVRKNGVLIGRVARVELEDQQVRITARIDSNRRLRMNEVCLIKTSSLLGDAILEFVPRGGEPGGPSDIIQDGAVLADGVVGSNPLEVLVDLQGDMKSAIGSIQLAANEVQVLAQNLNRTLGSDQGQVQRIMQRTETALEQFSSTMSTVDAVLGDPSIQDDLKRVLSELPEVFDTVKVTFKDAQVTMEEFRRVGQRAEQNLENFEGFTRPLGENGEQLITDISSSIRNVEAITAQLVEFSAALNNPDGSLGRLINDRELYAELSSAVDNINETTVRIRPIMADIRTFTDKIARDPRQLGVKGALDRRPLGLGLK